MGSFLNGLIYIGEVGAEPRDRINDTRAVGSVLRKSHPNTAYEFLDGLSI
jgi:hypothetical protein